MAATGNVSSSGTHTGPSLRDRVTAVIMHINAFRPDTAGVQARTWLRLRKVMGADAARIDVTTAGGYIELRGEVGSSVSAQRAVEVAKEMKGARGVLNFMHVK